MRKWKALGQAFENVDDDLRVACENIETNCGANEDFKELYVLYAMLLDTMKAQRKFIGEVFYEICDR